MQDFNGLGEKLTQIRQEIENGAAGLENSRAAYEFRKSFLDKKGKVGQLMTEMKNIAAENRAEYGKRVNELKTWATEFLDGIDEKMKQKESEARYEHEKLDITMPAKKHEAGNLHPITQVRNQLIDVFSAMGFEVYEGTEIETDYYNLSQPIEITSKDVNKIKEVALDSQNLIDKPFKQH